MTNVIIEDEKIIIEINDKPGYKILNRSGLEIEMFAGHLKVNGNTIYDDLVRGDRLIVNKEGSVTRECSRASIDAFIEQINRIDIEKARCCIL